MNVYLGRAIITLSRRSSGDIGGMKPYQHYDPN